MSRFIMVSGAALLFSAAGAMAQTATIGDNSNSMNPAARYSGRSAAHAYAPGTDIPGATGINPYSGKSVGMPLQPNDLGSARQERIER